VEDILPLAPGPVHMFQKYLRAPDNGIPFVQLVYAGRVANFDLGLLQQSWQCLVDRHPVLRTSFLWKGLDRPVQVVHRHCKFPSDYMDLRVLAPAAREQTLAAFIHQDRKRGFDASLPQPVRLLVAQLTDDEFQFILSANYMVMDGWSMSVLLGELNQYYARKADPYSHPSVNTPYARYLSWVKEQDLLPACNFLSKKLARVAEPTPLSKSASSFFAGNREFSKRASLAILDSADPAEPIARQSAFLSAEVTQSLQSVSKHHHLTMSCIANGAWAAVLSRLTGQEKVLFGIASTGRPPELPGIEKMVGRALNTLALVADLSKRQLPITEWLRTLQDDQIELCNYDYVSLEEVQKWSGLPADRDLLETCLLYQNLESLELKRESPITSELPDALTWLASYVRDIYLLRVDLFPCIESLLLVLTYKRSCFDSVSVGFLLDLYKQTLEYIAKYPESSVGELLSPPDVTTSRANASQA